MSTEKPRSFDQFLERLEKRAHTARTTSIIVTGVVIAVAALMLFFTVREVKEQIEGVRQEYSAELAKLDQVKAERAKFEKELETTRTELASSEKKNDKLETTLETKENVLKKVETQVGSQVVKKVENEIRKVPNKFAIIASRKTMEEAGEYARQVKAKGMRFPVEIYQREPNRYVITLGGNLTEEEAESRVEYAKRQGLAPDAYVRAARGWGKKPF